MATPSITSTSATAAAVEPLFTEPERLALPGFLAGYTRLTREACRAGIINRPGR
jgi:hypothetical protein